jgi:hypothetical protein
MYSICISRFVLAVVLLCLVGGASAQTPPPTTTNPCPSATAPAVASFAVERVIDPAQILTTITPLYAASVANGVQSGVLEIHEGITLDYSNQILSLNFFPKQTGSPIPTPPNGVTPGTVFSTIMLKVDKTYTTCTPSISVAFAGTVTANSPSSPFGNVTGATAAVSVRLSDDIPPKISNVVVWVGGTWIAYSATGAGSITFTTTPVTPPATGGGPAIIVNAPALTTTSVVDLDASATTSPNPPLTFAWTVVAGAADVAHPTAAKALGYILGSVGSYTFRVTVTDSKGNVSTKDVIIQYL